MTEDEQKIQLEDNTDKMSDAKEDSKPQESEQQEEQPQEQEGDKVKGSGTVHHFP